MNVKDSLNIESILSDIKPEYIPVDKLITSTSQSRQTDTKVDIDSKLITSIRKAGGLLYPIIVKSCDDGAYEVITGQRRSNAYLILRDEDNKYSNIRAYVIKKDLSEDEKKVISFIENFGRDDMDRIDYVNVIEYFYQKYDGEKNKTVKALGISINDVTKYLTHARLSDNVKKCIDNKDFIIDVAMKSLRALGDDENLVDDDQLIETAKALQKLKPVRRYMVVKKMSKGDSFEKALKSTGESTVISMEFTSDQVERLERYRGKFGHEDQGAAAVNAMDKELLRETKE